MFARKLIWQLYPPFLVIILVALIVATAYSSYAAHDFCLRQIEQELRLAADLVAPQIAEVLTGPSPSDIDALCKKLGEAQNGQMRLTVIMPDGKVVGESVEDPAHMVNHADRAEVIEALASGSGRSIRPSPTLGQDMMYVAVLLKQGNEPLAVVRTAIAVTAIDLAMRDTYVHIAYAGLVVALAAAILSLLVSRRITAPVVQMKRIAQLFAAGQLNIRVPTSGAAEMEELAKALNEMATQLQDRIMTITRQRNELQAVLSSLGEGVLAVDSRGHIVSLNKAAGQLLNLDPVRVQGCNVEEVIRDVGLQQFIRDTLDSDQPTEGDISFLEEGERFFHLQGAGLADPEAQRGGAVIVLSDRTAIRRLENVRKDFVANVSHELKTPVTSIQGFVEALLDGGINEPQQAHRYLGIIARHAERLNAIIDDLLALSRLEEVGGSPADRRTVSLEPTPIRPILEAAIEMSSVRAERKGMTVVLSCDASVEAKINAPLLEQAVLNLLDNAIKYSDEGKTVEVTVEEQNAQIAIHVRDNGCGIPAEHLSRIFQRFYVVDKSRSRKLGGTGLGLAIVKHIVMVHGGQVTVDSAPGKGSTFTIILPR
jgi:two-component system phosphate regulon sensor histidine kinase PhoR